MRDREAASFSRTAALPRGLEPSWTRRGLLWPGHSGGPACPWASTPDPFPGLKAQSESAELKGRAF